MSMRILTVSVQSELDVVVARQRARQIAELCSFARQDQARITTSVSELARNVYNYAGSGKIHFIIEGRTAPQVLSIKVVDEGPGIANLDAILAPQPHATGLGTGLLGAKRLMDRFDVKTSPKTGTEITLQKFLHRGTPLVTAQMCNKFCTELASLPSENSMAEVLQQNQELLATLAELKARQDDLLQLTQELEDTNRGVVALYAELDEKADHLRRADEMKSRFLSNMSHEFRTPLSSIRALAKLLLDRVDGELSVEQERQVKYILQSTLGLTDLVDDLLDLAKIEAGRIDVRPSEVQVDEIFSALRGMLRPLLVAPSVQLTFVKPEKPLNLSTDEAKLSQILRNFISNALKFTEIGEITVSAYEEDDRVTFAVTDSGIGIAPDDISLIFEEFGQIENALQRNVKGTGLGLPLCKKLASLLGGEVAVRSTVGEGSTFSLTLPRTYSTNDASIKETLAANAIVRDGRIPVLLVEDDPSVHLIYEKFLQDTEFQLIAARSVREALQLWPQAEPAAVVLDILLHGEDAWSWLSELKNDPLLKSTPILVATEVDDRRKGFALGAEAYYIKPLSKHQLISTLRQLAHEMPLSLTETESSRGS